MDIIIKNGKIIDGAGNPWFWGDIGIKEGKIQVIGNLKSESAEKVIDANKMIVCPGFIDVHSHADATNFINPKQESFLHQGITTTISGNCGYGLAPISKARMEQIKKYLGDIIPPGSSFRIDWTTFAEYLKKIEEVGIASNISLLLGHGTLRISVMGGDARAPTEKELEEMRAHVKEAMEAGALGLSTGLLYPPGIFAKTEEIIELCKVVSDYGGYYFSHIRSYGSKLMKSIKEAIKIGKEANVPVQISHLSIFGKPFFGSGQKLLEFLDKKRAEGVEINSDMHPYDSVQTDMQMLLPPWIFDGGKKKTLERLKDPEMRKKIKHDQLNGYEGWDEWFPLDIIGWENILPIMLKSEKYKALEGKNLKEIAELDEKDLYDEIYDLLIEEEVDANMIITHLRGKEDMVNFMKNPIIAFETDAAAAAPYGPLSKGKPHPRGYGTYPKFLGEFVRERKILTLEEAIKKSTSLPAQMASIRDRGLIKPGFWADIVIFNPDTIIDMATYPNPHQYPIGINHVIVNGEIVIEKGTHSGLLPGKVLRHSI